MEIPDRPITILIAALGGEGGGVLADWVVAAATAQDFPVQSTSIPGVAQRTGATTYYIEIYPAKQSVLGGRRPVMTLTPAPSYVDVMIASELLEAGRAMLNGYVTPERTTLIASTNRVYTVAEKMQMGDGRFDSERVIKAAKVMARRAILFDMQERAGAAGTVISAVMFGALAGSGTLPLSRADCEAAIRGFGRGAEASLKGFELGWAAAAGGALAGPGTAPSALKDPTERLRRFFPVETHALLAEGLSRCADFQDRDYASLYLDRLDTILALDRERGGGDSGYRLTSETGRFLALWMCYEDVIRVADLKTRRSRFERVREEVMAAPGEPVHIVEFLKPGMDEIAALLPRGLSRRLLGWAARRGLANRLNIGLHVKTSSVAGFLMLRSLAWLRPLRRKTSRWHDEQALIERWLRNVAEALRLNAELALEVALCARLIKGYGDTHRRGRDNFLRIIETLFEEGAATTGGSDHPGSTDPLDRARAMDPLDRARAIRAAREAALADPEGRALEGSLASHGITPLPPKPRPIRFVRRESARNSKVA